MQVKAEILSFLDEIASAAQQLPFSRVLHSCLTCLRKAAQISFPMMNDNKLECKEVELYARDYQNLLFVVLSDPVLPTTCMWREPRSRRQPLLHPPRGRGSRLRCNTSNRKKGMRPLARSIALSIYCTGLFIRSDTWVGWT